jgi:peroxiredoxin
MLRPNDQFPSITVTPPDQSPIELPNVLGNHFGVVLFNRGAWCPYCSAQLRSFQRAQDRLTSLNVQTVALSVDDEETTRDLIAKHGLTFPVGGSADARSISAQTGAFINDDPLYLQSTGFVLGPDGRVIVSVYSSGPIGRLVPDDVIGLVRYVQERDAAD